MPFKVHLILKIKFLWSYSSYCREPKVTKYIKEMSVFFSWFIGNESELETNKLCELERFVCSTLQFVPPWTQKKDTHFLYLQLFQK